MPEKTTPTSSPPLSGLWQPRLSVRNLYYGPGCVHQHLLSLLPKPTSRAIIITGRSLATQTPLVRQLEALLGPHHAGTLSHIRQHGPISDVESAVDTVLANPSIDTLISLGGGSPIDTAKVISYRKAERGGTFLTHLTIPTTLSAAECTAGGGYTKSDGTKVGFRAPEMGVAAIFYDPDFARFTPRSLWLSTGMRAMDHAVECMYHPTAAEVPWKALAVWAAGELYEGLRKGAQRFPEDAEGITRLMLAAFASSGLKGENVKGGMGLSHSLGHALGSPYGIAHGITSCMTLGKVVALKVGESAWNARQVARLLPVMGGQVSGDEVRDGLEVGRRIEELVAELGVEIPTLSARGLGKTEVAVITSRALGNVTEGPTYEKVATLVQRLF